MLVLEDNKPEDMHSSVSKIPGHRMERCEMSAWGTDKSSCWHRTDTQRCEGNIPAWTDSVI